MDETNRTSSLGLAEAIRDLRAEITLATAQAQDAPVKFALGPIELELQVALNLKGSTKGEAKWLIVSIGAEAGVERERTHKVKLTLTPQGDGNPILVFAPTDQKPD